jgi:hypothetical protein
MFSLSGKVPGYLLGKYQMTAIVVFTLLFATVFILLAAPYPGNTFFILATLILALSRFILYRVSRRSAPTYLKYIVWCVLEAVSISLLYIFLKSPEKCFQMLGDTFVKAVFALAPPHLIAGLYFSLQEKDNVIRLMNYGNVVSDETFTPQSGQKITLFDNSGVMKLSITAANLYYIESDDNYIRVWYEDSKGDLKKYLLRCRLKTVEESFRGSNLVRCHRKFIVNMARVKVLRKEKEGYLLDLDCESIEPVPVTKTYEKNVLEWYPGTLESQ